MSNIFQKATRIFSKYDAEILLSVGIGGMLTSTVLAVRSTPKALRIIERRKEELKTENLPGVEIVKTTWKYYIPTLVSCALSTACLIFSGTKNHKRNVALATLCQISETTFSKYKDKVIETLGEEKEHEIREEIDEETLKQTPCTNVIITGNGKTVCFDSFSGRYFESDIASIDKAINKINHSLLGQSYISLNELYSELGLDFTDNGYLVGWNAEDGLIEQYYSSKLSEDGTPCVVLSFENPPKPDFDIFR